jgi:hypothetical protein
LVRLSKIGSAAKAHPHIVGRNTFSSDAPLKKVSEVLDDCQGAVVIALERSFFPSGIDKRGGPKEARLSEIRLPNPWNHIEAAMAHSRRFPLMVRRQQAREAGRGPHVSGAKWLGPA